MSYPTPFEIMELLENQRIHYRMDAFQPDVLTITASVPGQLWEIQCFPEVAPDIEIFISETSVQQIDSLDMLKSISDPWADKE